MIVCTPAAIAARNGARPASTSPTSDRQLEVRVLLGRAVAGEVLRAGGDAPACVPAHERRDVPRDERGVGAERARPDHGVRRARSRRRPARGRVDADGGELGRDRRGDRLGQRDVVDDAERGAARVRAAGVATRAASRRRPPRRCASSTSSRSARSDAAQRGERRRATARCRRRARCPPPPPARKRRTQSGASSPGKLGKMQAAASRSSSGSPAHRPGGQPEGDPPLHEQEEDDDRDRGQRRRRPSARPSRCAGSCRGSTRARPSPSASTGRSAGRGRRCTRSRS